MFNFNDVDFGPLLAGLGAFLVFFIIIGLAILVFQIVVEVKVFKKAGKGGWEAIIPFYSNWVLCEITGLKWWFFLIMNAITICNILGLVFLSPLASIASLGAMFFAHYNLAKRFGKDPIGYGIGLTLLPVVFYAILAFSNDTYTDCYVSPYGPINDPNGNAKDENKTESKTTSKKASKGKGFCKNCGAKLGDGKFCPSCGTEVR